MSAGPRSQQAFERAQRSIPGGVDSPVRAFKGVGGQPVFIASAKGSKVTDVDGKTYIDYVGSWGPLVLGHADDEVLGALSEVMARGTSYGAPTELETELAEQVKEAYPSMDLLRFVNSGTEATMSALRLARGFTGRDVIIKFEGCYHGHADSLLVKAGSGLATLGVPSSAGVPADTAKHTLTLPFNDLQALEDAFARAGDQIAAVILEPVAGNMGVITPVDGFLDGMRTLCDRHGAVLIFDEVMTGWRVGLGGAQGHFGITPDLTTLGKVIGGGLPVGAYGGRRDIMERIAPLGPVYQAGTLSGNPLAMTAGLVTLRRLHAPGVFDRAAALTATLLDGLLETARAANVPVTGTAIGTMFGVYLSGSPVRNYQEAAACDTERFGRFHGDMLDRGVYLAPSAFEAGFVSTAHSEEDVSATLDAARAVW